MREAIKKFFSLRLEFGTIVHLSGTLYEQLNEAREAHIKAEITYGMNRGAYDRCLEIGADRNTVNAWLSNLREAERKCRDAKRKYEAILAAYRDFGDANDERVEVQGAK